MLIILFFTVQSFAFETPMIEHMYGTVYDWDCKDFKGKREAVLAESKKVTAQIGPIWKKHGEPLLKETFELLGRGFYRKELTAYTTACAKAGSMSKPYMVNIVRYLSTQREKPEPLIFAIQPTYHEFLHKYLVSTFAHEKSKLIEKYKNERELIRNHIHLMAIEKTVYERLGRKDLIEYTETRYKGFSPYKRAYEIATKIEKTAALIKEVRKLKGGTNPQ